MTVLFKFSRKKAAKHPEARWDALNEFLAFADITDLTPVQRVAYLAYWYSSIILAAGHREYFLNSKYSYHAETVAALRTIGTMAHADTLVAAQRAVSIASERAPEEYEDRHLAGVEFADLFEFDEAIERCNPSVPDALMGYLDKHEAEFIDWKP